MPRVEKNLKTSARTISSVTCYTEEGRAEIITVPKGVDGARLVIEWDDPPANDWTPAKTALHMWNVLGMTREEIANQLFELERDACAEVVNKMMEDFGKEYECQYETLLDAKVRILARTNEDAGYPRMRES